MLCQQWKNLSRLFLLSIAVEASVTSFLPREAAIEMIVLVKYVILYSTFNLHMLHLCVQIMYCYFLMKHMGGIRVCVFPFPSLLLFFRPLFLMIVRMVHGHIVPC